MNAVSDTWYLFVRHIKDSLRTPIWLLINLIQPLVWLLLFSKVFEGVAELPGFTTDSYLQFFAPGVIIMTVLFALGVVVLSGILASMDLWVSHPSTGETIEVYRFGEGGEMTTDLGVRLADG